MFRETFLHYLKHNGNSSRSTWRSTKQCSYSTISSSNNFLSKFKCSFTVCFRVFNHLHTLTRYDHIPILAFGCWNKFTQIFHTLLIRQHHLLDQVFCQFHLFSSRRQHRKGDRKSTRLNSSHVAISYAVFCLKKKINKYIL